MCVVPHIVWANDLCLLFTSCVMARHMVLELTSVQGAARSTDGGGEAAAVREGGEGDGENGKAAAPGIHRRRSTAARGVRGDCAVRERSSRDERNLSVANVQGAHAAAHNKARLCKRPATHAHPMP